MVHWKHKLNLENIFGLYNNSEITLVELGAKIAKTIETSHFYSDYAELEDIISDFYGMEDDDTVEYFDEILGSLYDWGDDTESDVIKVNGPVRSKTCWITTK